MSSGDESDDIQIFVDDRILDPSVPSCSGYQPNKKSKSKKEKKKQEENNHSTRSTTRKKEKTPKSSSAGGPFQAFLNSPRNFVPEGVRIKDYLRIDPMTWHVLKNLKYAKRKVGGRGDKAIKIYSSDEDEPTTRHPTEEEMFSKCDEIIMSYLPSDSDESDDESCKQRRKSTKNRKSKGSEGPLTDEALVFHYTNSSVVDSEDHEQKDSDEDIPSGNKPRIKHRQKINYKKIHEKKNIKKSKKKNAVPSRSSLRIKEAKARISGKCAEDFKSSVRLPKPRINKDLAAYKHILGNRIPRVTLSRISIKGNSLNLRKASTYARGNGSLKDKKGKGKKDEDLLPREKAIDNHVLRVSIWKIDEALHDNLK